MVLRGKRLAANKFYKMARPLIASGDKAGQRDTERITARIQVIPDVTDSYGTKLLTGFTVDEIKQVIETGERIWCENGEGVVTAEIKVGSGDDEWTLTELREVLDMVGEDGPVMRESPMNAKDMEEATMKQALAPKKVGRPKKNVAKPTPGTEEAD